MRRPVLLALTLPALLLGNPLFAQEEAPALTFRASILPQQSTYYAGQTIRLCLEFEARNEELGRFNLSGLPSPEWAQARQENLTELAGSSEVKDGAPLHTRRFALDYLLLQSGSFPFRPRTIAMLSRRTQRGAGGPFFSSFIESHQVSAQSSPLTLSVAPLPTPAPTNSCGLVGDLRLTASIQPESASPGDLVNLVWTLHGIANFSDFTLPPLPPADGFKAYEPKIDIDSTNDTLRVAQVFVPQSLTSTNLPAFSLSVFNPVKAAYETLQAGPFTLSLHERVAEPVPVDFPTPASASNAPAASALPAPDWSADSFTLPAPFDGYLAPSTQSLRLHALPTGTPVRVLERHGRWLRVESNGSSVWIQGSENEL